MCRGRDDDDDGDNDGANKRRCLHNEVARSIHAALGALWRFCGERDGAVLAALSTLQPRLEEAESLAELVQNMRDALMKRHGCS